MELPEAHLPLPGRQQPASVADVVVRGRMVQQCNCELANIRHESSHELRNSEANQSALVFWRAATVAVGQSAPPPHSPDGGFGNNPGPGRHNTQRIWRQQDRKGSPARQ